MSENLQGLLNKINEEGIAKAENKKKEILASAEVEAKKLLEDAKAEAKKIVADSQAEAKMNKEKAEAAIKQVARDIVIELNGAMQKRMNDCVKDLIDEAMTPEIMGEMVVEMSKQYVSQHDEDLTLKLIFPQRKINDTVDRLRKTFADSFKNKPEVFPGLDFASGLKIGFKGSDIFYDFSDEALTEMVCEYIGPRLAAVLR